MNRLRTNIVMLLILLTVSIGRSAEPSFNTERRQNGGTNKWQIQVGWVHQWGRGVTMSDHSPSLLNGRYLGSSVLPTLTYPDNAAIIAREFNDGYVRLDYWTGDAGLLSGPNPERYGMTWNWGNDRARQYNYDSGNHPTLTYHIDRGTVMDDAITVTQGATSDDIPTQGVEVKTTYLLYSWTNGCGDASSSYTNVFFNIDLALGLAWFPTTKQQFNRSTSRNVFAVMERYTFLDYYGVTTAPGGPWPALVVPYLGTYGSATDAGPIIPVTPESADLASGLMGTYSDNVMIESRLWHLRSEVGLVFTKPFYKHFNVYLSPQFVLEL
ncbi:MAG: hypothetical protein ACOYOU_14555 [Kiritimatiellia bacterium]